MYDVSCACVPGRWLLYTLVNTVYGCIVYTLVYHHYILLTCVASNPGYVVYIMIDCDFAAEDEHSKLFYLHIILYNISGELKGAYRVGTHAIGLLLRGECSVELVLMCASKPTHHLFNEVATRLPAKFEVKLIIIV